MKIKVALLLLCAFITFDTFAHGPMWTFIYGAKWTPIQLGVFPFFLFDPETDVYGLNCGTLLTFQAGGEVYGLSVAPFHVDRGLYGATVGLYTIAVDHSGILVSPFSFVANNYGIQAGIVNFSTKKNSWHKEKFDWNGEDFLREEGHFGGLQIGLYNQSDAPGLQFGLLNRFSQDEETQYDELENDVFHDLETLDPKASLLTLVPNITRRHCGGLQIGLFNISNAAGVQIGLCNYLDASGFQIGVFNVLNGRGFQIGLLNHNPEAQVEWLPIINFHF